MFVVLPREPAVARVAAPPPHPGVTKTGSTVATRPSSDRRARALAIKMIPAPTGLTPAKIAAWVSALGKNRFAARIQAEKRLVRAGNVATPALRAALGGQPSAQVQATIYATLKKIERIAVLRGPLVSLHVVNTPVQKILRRICRQVGIVARFDASLKNYHRTLTVDVQRQPFWKVLQRIAGAVGVSPTPFDGGFDPPPLTFGRRGLFEKGAPVAVDGRLAIAMESLAVGRTRNFAGPAYAFSRQHYSQLQLVLLWLPIKTQWVYGTSVGITHAVDNNGKVLVAPDKPVVYGPWDTAPRPDIADSCGISIACPSTGAKNIAMLRGNIRIKMSTGVQTRAATKLNSGHASILIRRMHLAFSKPVRKNGQWHITLRLHVPINSAADWVFDNQVLDGALTFKSASGQTLAMAGGVTQTAENEVVDFYGPGPKPVSAVIKIHRHIIHLKIPFVFRNVPIPR